MVATALGLALARWLVVAHGVQEPLIPGPEQVVQSFLCELGTSPQQALRTLAPSLRLRTSAMDLLRIDQMLRCRCGSYAFQPGGRVRCLPGGVEYVGLLRTPAGETLQAPIRLRRDPLTGLWQITSLSGLMKLTSPRDLAPPDDVPVRV